jgi:hypothetical protein
LIATVEGKSWTVSLRVVAYDGELAEARAQEWIKVKRKEDLQSFSKGKLNDNG